MTRPAVLGALALAACFAAAPAMAEKPKPRKSAPAAQAVPDCPRASYKGDPVCFGWDAATELPTPSANAIPREKSDDVRINEDLTVSGADPKVMKKTPVDQYLNNPNPNPRKQDVSGGAAVNYKF